MLTVEISTLSILGRQENKNTILIADGHVLKYKWKTTGDSRICDGGVGAYVCSTKYSLI